MSKTLATRLLGGDNRAFTGRYPHRCLARESFSMTTHRRTFLKTAGLAVAATAAGAATARAADPQKLTVGVIGPGGMGMHHVRALCARKDVEIAYVCDVDQKRLADAAKAVEIATKKAPKTPKDMREVLDDKKVDAVFIA